MLKFADAEEAEAVYSMVALTQSHHDAWAEGQGTTAPHAQHGQVRQGSHLSGCTVLTHSGFVLIQVTRGWQLRVLG